MKKILTLLLAIISFQAIAQNVSISGTVENATSDTLTLIYDPLLLGIKPQTQQQIFTTDKSFKFNLDVDKNSIVELRFQKQQIILFIAKGDKIELNFDG